MLLRMITIVFIIASSQVWGQQEEIPAKLINQIETYLEGQESTEVNIDDLFAIYSGFQSTPLSINDATYEDFLQLQLIDEFKILSLLDYRSEYGDLISLEELQIIEGWTVTDAKFLASFSTVKGASNYQLSPLKMATSGKHELYLKWKKVLSEQRGYDPDNDSGYLGDNNAYQVRYRYNYENRMRYGIILEKDPGEEFFAGSNSQGFDYFSAHFYVKDYSDFLKDIAIGDYTISMGQGLITHNDFGAGKSAWVNDVKLGGRPIKPYNSVAENFYNRGAAARVSPIDNLDVTVFGSITKKDGNIQTLDTIDIDNPDVRFSSFLASGNHRTENENEKEDSIDELKFGGIVKYSRRNWHIAGNVQYQDYSATLDSSTQLYNVYRFAGSTLLNTSIDYGYRYKNFSFYGEVANSNPGGIAQMHGLLLGLDRNVSMSLVYRNYTPQYNAILPNAFGESASVRNEEGIYLGLEVRPSYAWTFRMYADLWKNPWLKFGTDSPSTGREYLARIDYNVKRKLNIYLQYFSESKFSNSSESTRIDQPTLQNRQRLRLHVSQKVTKALELRSRAEFSRFTQGSTSNGYALMQDIIYKPIDFPLSLTTRLVLFDTDDFDTRIYAFENDILYEFFIPAYFDQGMRYYINLRWKATRMITAEFRYANTRYTNRETIGSGQDLIDGNTRNDIKAQIRFTF